MKLLNKHNLYYIVFSFALFCIGGILFSYTIPSVFKDELDEQLLNQQQKIVGNLSTINLPFNNPIVNLNGDMEISETSAGAKTKQILKDTLIFDPIEKEKAPFRQLTFYADIKGKAVKISIRKSLVETDDLMNNILLNMSLLFSALLLGLLLIDHVLLKKIWAPFYAILNSLKEFTLFRHQNISLPDTTTSEFADLKQALEKMMHQIHSDYTNLKEFTENAAHEIQTPLAIIKSKLELLIQSSKIPAEEITHIQSAYEAVNRLSKLNQALLLLSKIENHQFHDHEDVNISTLLEQHLSNLEDLIGFKKLNVEKYLAERVVLKMSANLAEVLISNILNNAIKHNVTNGEIKITLTNEKLVLSNTGKELNIKPEDLFQRFKKASSLSDSLGLGLSIVKKICELYDLAIVYHIDGNLHTIEVSFTGTK